MCEPIKPFTPVTRTVELAGIAGIKVVGCISANRFARLSIVNRVRNGQE